MDAPPAPAAQGVVPDEVSRNLLLHQYQMNLEAQAEIAQWILALRNREWLCRCGGFQAERLTEILEETYGGERMVEVLEDIRARRHNSPFYQETKAQFAEFRRNGVTEEVLRQEWQGRRRP